MFDEWMKQLDKAVSDLSGLSAHDLADQPYRDWFDSGYSPEDAAREALKNEGYPVELL